MKRVALLATMVVLVGCDSSPHRLMPARFAADHGWHVGANAKAERSWAVLHGPSTDAGMWMGLRPGEIAISLNLVRMPSKVNYDYGMSWPPRLTRRHLSGFEGLPQAMTAFQWYAQLEGGSAALIVVFGSKPTSVQLDRANAELRSARIP